MNDSGNKAYPPDINRTQDLGNHIRFGAISLQQRSWAHCRALSLLDALPDAPVEEEGLADDRLDHPWLKRLCNEECGFWSLT
jgi:hypothetical protein